MPTYVLVGLGEVSFEPVQLSLDLTGRVAVVVDFRVDADPVNEAVVEAVPRWRWGGAREGASTRSAAPTTHRYRTCTTEQYRWRCWCLVPSSVHGIGGRTG